jgi:hypothetical protein
MPCIVDVCRRHRCVNIPKRSLCKASVPVQCDSSDPFVIRRGYLQLTFLLSCGNPRVVLVTIEACLVATDTKNMRSQLFYDQGGFLVEEVKGERNWLELEPVYSTKFSNVSSSLPTFKKLYESISEVIPVRSHGGLQCCQASRLAHFLDSVLTVVSRTRRPLFIRRKIHGAYFCQRLSRPQDWKDYIIKMY